jgi:hypothetical protein
LGVSRQGEFKNTIKILWQSVNQFVKPNAAHGAAKTSLINTGDVSTNVPGTQTGSWSDHASGCIEGEGSTYNPGNGNVHFNNNNGSGSRGYRICKSI